MMINQRFAVVLTTRDLGSCLYINQQRDVLLFQGHA